MSPEEIDEHSRVSMKALIAFAKTQPSGKLPGWFVANQNCYPHKDASGAFWCATIFLYMEIILDPGDSWEVINGRKMPVHIDNETGKRSICISYGSYEEDAYEFFKAKIPVDGSMPLIEFALEVPAVPPEIVMHAGISGERIPRNLNLERSIHRLSPATRTKILGYYESAGLKYLPETDSFAPSLPSH